MHEEKKRVSDVKSTQKRVSDISSGGDDIQDLKSVKGEFTIVGSELRESVEYGTFLVLAIIQNKEQFQVYSFSAPIMSQISDVQASINKKENSYPLQAEVKKGKGQHGSYYTLI